MGQQRRTSKDSSTLQGKTNSILLLIGLFIFMTGLCNLLIGFLFSPPPNNHHRTVVHNPQQIIDSQSVSDGQKKTLAVIDSSTFTLSTNKQHEEEEEDYNDNNQNHKEKQEKSKLIGPDDYENNDHDNDNVRQQLKTTKAHQFVTDPNHKLPTWITNYFDWHASMRSKFPGDEIFTHPDAPPVLIRKCLESLCGGLHDRLGQLPMDLYLANQTKRMLFIAWIKPYSIEHFLVPPDASLPGNEYSFDWQMPPYQKYGTKCAKRKHCLRHFMALPELEGNVVGQRRGTASEKTLPQLIEESIYNLTEGVYKDEKAVTFEILGHLKENYLEEKLRELGETDMIHNTPSFGKIFLSFFTPSPNVQAIIDQVNEELGLVSKGYTAVHCRVRHPFGYRKAQKFNGIYAGKADRYIPEFIGDFKDTMVGTAIKAIKCAATKNDQDKMYFMSDMSDLIDYVAFNLTDTNYVSSHPEWFEDEQSANVTAKNLVARYEIVAREQNTPNLHIDKAVLTNVEDYYGAFVDLFLGIHANCVAYGIGFYAAFAAKISGTKCLVKYATELYGGSKEKVRSDQSILCDWKLAAKM